MRKLRRSAVAVLVAAGLAAPSAAQATRSVYVTNSGTFLTGLAPFATSSSGSLTPVGTPVAAGDDANGVLVSPDARTVYVADTADDDITSYSIGASGALTLIGRSSVDGNQPTGLGITPDGSYLFVTNRDSSESAPSVSVFAIDPATGAPTLISTPPVNVGVHDPRAVVVSPDGRFAYVTARRGPLGAPASNADTALAVLSIGADGSLAPIAGSPFYLPGQVNSFGASFSPDGSRLFMAQLNGNAIHVFDLNATTGAPSEVTGSPFSAANAPIELTVTPDGSRLYATEPTAKAVEGFAINQATGALTQIVGTPVTVAGQTDGLAITPDGKNLYDSLLADPGAVEGFTIGTVGALAPVSGTPFATGGKFPSFFSVAVTPTQTPVPDFSSSPGKAGEPTSFDASRDDGARRLADRHSSGTSATAPRPWRPARAGPTHIRPTAPTRSSSP